MARLSQIDIPMMRKMGGRNLLSILGLVMLLGACGQAPNTQASIDDDSVAVKVFEPLLADCSDVSLTALTAGRSVAPNLGEGGGGVGGQADREILCSAYTVEVSGTAYNTATLLVEAGGSAFATTVNDSGAFSATFTISDRALLDTLGLTPISEAGDLGACVFPADREDSNK